MPLPEQKANDWPTYFREEKRFSQAAPDIIISDALNADAGDRTRQRSRDIRFKSGTCCSRFRGEHIVHPLQCQYAGSQPDTCECLVSADAALQPVSGGLLFCTGNWYNHMKTPYKSIRDHHEAGDALQGPGMRGCVKCGRMPREAPGRYYRKKRPKQKWTT